MAGLLKYATYKQVEGYNTTIPDGSIAQFANASTYVPINKISWRLEVININTQPIRVRFSCGRCKRDVPMIYYTNTATPTNVTTSTVVHPILNMLNTDPHSAMGVEDITNSLFTDSYDNYNYHTNGFGQAKQLSYWFAVRKLKECRIEGGATSIFYFSYTPKMKLNGALFMPNMTVPNWNSTTFNNNGIAFFRGLNDQFPIVEFIGESATAYITDPPTYESVRSRYALRLVNQIDVHMSVPPYRNTTIYNEVQSGTLPAPYTTIESSSGTVTTTFTGMPTNPQGNVTSDVPGPL